MNKKQKKMNNKGFSIVELIIVIAIMAVLVGVLAPTYLGYVEKSRKSTDVQNAQELATSIGVKAAVADASTGLVTTTKTEITASNIATISNLTSVPAIKVKPASGTYKWFYEYNGTEVKIYIGTSDSDAKMVYPTVDSISVWAQ